jgi:hypothetical protein
MLAGHLRAVRVRLLKEALDVSPRPSAGAHLNDLGFRFPLDIKRSKDVFSVALGRSPAPVDRR